MKGIILAGGKGERLYPATIAVNKHLHTIFNKPMIYYPLSILMLLKIKDIALICNPEDENLYKKLLGNGEKFGIKLTYVIQKSPKGLADAYILNRKFLKNQRSLMILGDNFFYGAVLMKEIKKAINSNSNMIFCYEVKNPSNFGVIQTKKNKILKIIEKPKNNISDLAITGLYFFDNNSSKYALKIKPSKRGEIEITSLLKIYLEKKKLKFTKLGRGVSWLDLGTFKNMQEASNLVKIIENRQGRMIGCLEEIAFNNNWITKKSLKKIINKTKNETYRTYLQRIIR